METVLLKNIYIYIYIYSLEVAYAYQSFIYLIKKNILL